MTAGSYTYAYTIVDAGGESARSDISSTVTTTMANGQVLVSGLPASGTWRLYRRRSTLFFFVAERTDQATYVDTTADPPSSTILPQAQNRIASAFSAPCTATTCGWIEFAPGVPANVSNNWAPSVTAPTAPTGKGWLVDPSGSVHFAAGNWTFTVEMRNGGASASGTARLALGLWKLKTDGTAVGTALIDPGTAGEQTSQNLITGNTTPFTVTHTVALPPFSLAADERLYVQFWRRQTVPYVNVFNNDARVLTLVAHDGTAGIVHPAVSTLPDAPVLASPADGAVTSSRSLSAFFSDPDAGDSGLALEAGGVRLDVRTRRAEVEDADVELTAKEFTLLETFLRHPGQVLSREQLLSHVWGYDFDPGSNVVDVYVGYLRRKLGAERFETVLAAAQVGLELPVAALFREFHPRVLRYLRAHVPDRAEELASDTWSEIAAGLPEFEGNEASFRRWVFAAARRRLQEAYGTAESQRPVGTAGLSGSAEGGEENNRYVGEAVTLAANAPRGGYAVH